MDKKFKEDMKKCDKIERNLIKMVGVICVAFCGLSLYILINLL